MLLSSISRESITAILLTLIILFSGCTATQQSNHQTTVDPATIADPQPSDELLVREDTVVVRNASEPLASSLELIVHRVDALRDGDATRHRIIIEVGGINGTTRVTRRTGQFARLDSDAIQLIGFASHTPQNSPTRALALTERVNESAFVIRMPTPERVAQINAVSYQFVLAHELGGIVLDRPSNETLRESAPPQITTDFILARRGIAEGVATYVGVRYTERYKGQFDPSYLKPDAGDDWRGNAVRAVYFRGYRYVSVNSVDSVFDTLDLRSTSQLLHPNRTGVSNSLPPEPFAESSLREYEHTYTDRPGELLVRELFASHGDSYQRAGEIATGWRNGRVDQYVHEDTVLTTWVTVWETRAEAREFLHAYRRVVDLRVVSQYDRSECVQGDRLAMLNDTRVVVFQCQ